MKKFILALSSLIIFTLVMVNIQPTLSTNATDYEDRTVEALGATYTVTKNLINREIGYGITHIKDRGLSSASNLNNYDSCGPKDTLVGQQVNVLSIPSNEAVRIVNWTYLTPDSWTKQTVRKIAENFEYHNPGWKVIAGINGDFFDINGNAELPYHASGYTVTNGNVTKPFGSASAVGFKNDGSGYQLVGGQKIEAGPLKLQIVDKNDNVIEEFDVQKINSEVAEGEVGVWFSYNEFVSDVRTLVPVTVQGDDVYVCDAPIRCLPMKQTTIYAKGVLGHQTEETTLKLGQFAVETSNEKIQAYMENGAIIRIQQNIVGAYADCDNITGAGIQLLKDGVAVGDSDLNRHPRTCVGIKADGSVVFFTVDGRQFDSDMYGMSSAEMAAALTYYGCVEGYNLDGGGSTTIITRNQYGDFDVHNSPSDGGERSDSNALLVVVPEISLEISDVSDTSVTIEYRENTEVRATNVKFFLNDDVRSFSGYELVWDNLEPQTNYELTYTYDIEYKNSVLKGQKNTLYFTTGKVMPKHADFYYEETDTEYLIHFKLIDEGKTLTSPRIKYDVDGSSKSISISTSSSSPVSIPKVDGLNPNSFVFSGRYNIASSQNETVRYEIPISKFETHSLTFNLDGGTLDTMINSYDSHDIPLQLPEPERTGFEFIGWYDTNGNRISSITNTNFGDLNLTAVWKVKYAKLIVDIGGTITETVYMYGDTITYPENPTKKGHTFVGWNSELPTTMSEENVILTAAFTPNTYKVVVKINDTQYEVNYQYGQQINSLETPQVDGYTFEGWDKELPSTMPDYDITITASMNKIAEKESGCGCNSAIFIMLTSILSLGILLVRRKNN